MRGERLSVKEKARGVELGSDLDPDLLKTLWIRIRQNNADPLDPDPQLCYKVCQCFTTKNPVVSLLTFGF